jgi:DNA-binding NarL/FixJ family response regulator
MIVGRLFSFQCPIKCVHSFVLSVLVTTILIYVQTSSTGTVGYVFRHNAKSYYFFRYMSTQPFPLHPKNSLCKSTEDLYIKKILLNPLRFARSPKSKLNDIDNEVDHFVIDEEEEKNGNSENEEHQRRVKRHKYWIMLVDDEESIRLAVGRYLYESGYQVTACSDSDAAIEVLTVACNFKNKNNEKQRKRQKEMKQTQISKVPDTIILDVRMPGSTLNGIELLQWIRSNDNGPMVQTIPVIMLTAKGLTQDRIVGYQAGATAYLTKPFNPLELLSIVDNAILRNEQIKYSTSTQVMPRTENLHNDTMSNVTVLAPTPIALIEMKNDIETIKEMIQQLPQNRITMTDIFLTPAERDVLQLLGQGMTKQEIASARNVTSIQSITRIMNNLYKKTNLSTRTGLIRWAIETGYLPRGHQG